MMTKTSFVLFFIVGLVAAASVPAPAYESDLKSDLQKKAGEILSHNLISGSRQNGDYLLSQQIVTKDSGWLQVQTLDVTFKTPKNQIITQVRALDQKTNGNGAYASITKGGPGNKDVTVHFESQRGYSIKFILEVYGK